MEGSPCRVHSVRNADPAAGCQQPTIHAPTTLHQQECKLPGIQGRQHWRTVGFHAGTNLTLRQDAAR
eukprot:4053454-Amphidinium_carterae.1